MKNPLHNELEELRYISISSIDPYDIPESVVIYFKNNSEVNKRISVEPIHGVQLDLQNQNPTIKLEDYKATFCLGPSPYIPIVTINPISDFTDPSYPLTVTITGTITRTDNYIPNEIVVNYNNQNKRATLINDTEWSVTFDLRIVSQNLTEYVTAKANSIDVNSSVISGYSEIVTSEFNIIFLEVECTPSVDKVSCLCLDVTKNYKVTVDGQSITGTFEEVVAFLDKHGLYAYPSIFECNPPIEPLYEGSSEITEEVPTISVNVELVDVEKEPLYYLYNNTTYYYRVFIRDTYQLDSNRYVKIKDNSTGLEYLLNSSNNFETMVGVVFENTNPYINGISSITVYSNFNITEYSLPLSGSIYNIYSLDQVLLEQTYTNSITTQQIVIKYTEAVTGIAKTLSTFATGVVNFEAKFTETVNVDLNYPLTITFPTEFIGHSIDGDGKSKWEITSNGGTIPATNTVVIQKKSDITNTFDLKLRVYTSDKVSYNPLYVRQLYINQINIVGNQ